MIDAAARLEVRDKMVAGVGPWLWRVDDFWAWQHPALEFPALRELIMKHTKSHRVMVQAGGCMGMYPRLFAEHFDRVVTFEPDRVNFRCLAHNCADRDVVKFQAALSDKAGVCSFKPGAPMNAGMGSIGGNGMLFTVATLPLDALDLPTVDVIQLDCEGSEEKALLGARSTIERCRPTIAVEHPDARVRGLMFSLGYAVAGRCGSMPDVVFTPQ